MRRVHGEYPFDRECWNNIWRYEMQTLSKVVVDAFLLGVPVQIDDQGELPNKGFRVVRVEYSANGGKVFAVYNHDREYHLISAAEEEFFQVDVARVSLARQPYRCPDERLPYPAY